MSDVIDRCLVRYIFSALAKDDKAESSGLNRILPEQSEHFGVVSVAATTLRNSSIEPIDGARILPFLSVVKCRGSIAVRAADKLSRHVHAKTVETRIRASLAAKNVHLVKESSKTQCYMVGDCMSSLLASSLKESIKMHKKGLTEKERRKLLDKVGNMFLRRKQKYWNGTWNLNEELSGYIPRMLWRDIIMQMASSGKLTSWHIAAIASKKRVADVFPESNQQDSLPQPSLEDCLSDPCTDYYRSDMLLCVKALKRTEQIVFARTNSISGPLNVCMSVAGIVELSPSFRSVESALGLGLSYNRTEAQILSCA